MKKMLYLAKFILLLVCFVGYGQNLQNNNWIYGSDVLGLNFIGPTVTGFPFPTIPAPQFSAYLEGSATLSDQNGNLLLFSDGERLWQKQGSSSTLITSALKGHFSSTQNVIFIPKPGSPTRYFVVTINGETSDYLGLYYSEIDVANATLIAPVNRTLFTGIYYDQDFNQFPNKAINEAYGNQSQSITSYPHANGKDYWLVAHVQNNESGVLLSYKVTCNGISGGLPEKSKVFKLSSGIAHTLKISPNGSRIVLNTQYSLYHGTFNNNTGEINLNNRIDASNSAFTGGYSAEFSPNSNVLFYSEGIGVAAKDLITNSTTIIPTNSVSITEVGIQLARDGKIYIADDTVKVINNPNDITNLQLNDTGFNCGLNIGLPQWVYWQPGTASNLVAQNDTFNFNSCVTSTSSQSVLQANPTLPDTFNGNPIASLTGYTLAVVGAVTPTPSVGGISLNPANGLITVLSGTPTGTYKIKYRICEANSCPVCSNDAVVTINVTYVKGATPTFSLINPLTICNGATVPVLPSTSLEGIPGTWSPSVISNTVSGEYIFTPAPHICAATAIVTVTVLPTITPVFSFNTSLCNGQQAPVLPNISDNGIAGTWSPSAINNTVSGTYTFSPSGKSTTKCVIPTTITVTVTPKVIPVFTISTTLCAGNAVPLLPTTSNNGITGTWNPSIVNPFSSGTYTFTPASGVCAAIATITISIQRSIVPIFSFNTSLCSGQQAPVLPGISDNGIAGTWNPATVSNTTTGNYIFTPASGSCAETTVITITVTPTVVPVFSFNTSLCSGDQAPVLPGISDNGIVGSWSPSTVSNTMTGNYTFTPIGGSKAQCVGSPTITVIVNECNELPQIGCINFDPTNSTTNILEHYAYVNFGPISVPSAITFEWYFKFKEESNYRIFYGQNPTFDVECPTNPVMSFGLIVSNGITSVRYYSGAQIGPHHIPGFSGEFRTCFIHVACEPLSESKNSTTSNSITNYTPINVFPNPTNSILRFEGENLEKYSILLFDITGKEVLKSNQIDNGINVEKLEAGFYIYRITHNDNFVQQGKIIKN